MKLKRRIAKTFKNLKEIYKRPEMAVLPAHLAFFFLLSIVPIITLIGYGATLFDLPMTFITEFIEKAFSAEVADLLVPYIGDTSFSVGFFIIFLICFYIASNGCKSLVLTSNAIYGYRNKGKINTRVKSIIMTIILVLLFLFLLLVPLFGNKIIDLIKYMNGDDSLLTNVNLIFQILKGPFSWVFMFFVIKIIYTMAPDKKIPSSSVNVGALFTTIGWTLTTAIYSYYVTHYARYDLLFAGLSNIVILILWLYFLSTIFVYGMALNSSEMIEMEKSGNINNNN